MKIKFMQYYVTDGQTKARVSYSLDNRTDNRNCVTIYAQDYDRSLGKIFRDTYKNETDSMTDYFDKGNVVLFNDHPLYKEAREKAEFYNAKRLARRNK